MNCPRVAQRQCCFCCSPRCMERLRSTLWPGFGATAGMGASIDQTPNKCTAALCYLLFTTLKCDCSMHANSPRETNPAPNGATPTSSRTATTNTNHKWHGRHSAAKTGIIFQRHQLLRKRTTHTSMFKLNASSVGVYHVHSRPAAGWHRAPSLTHSLEPGSFTDFSSFFFLMARRNS